MSSGRFANSNLWLLPPAVIYFAIGTALILTRPGLQGDEAYLLEGAVRLFRGEDLVQLMATPYHGAIKTYATLPVFLITGVNTEASRVVNLLIGFAGIAGAGVYARTHFGVLSGVVASLLLAVHPGYVSTVVWDSTGTPAIMLATGLVLIGLARATVDPAPRSVFFLGVALGFGGWVRANFIWSAAALGLAVFLVREPMLGKWRSLAVPFTAGGLLGALPLLVYQVVSRGGTFRYMSSAGAPDSLLALLTPRLKVAFQVLFYDPHRRYVWGAEAAPVVETWTLGCLLVAALALSLIGAPRSGTPGTRRLIALWLLLAVALALTTHMPLGPHHFSGFLPLALLVIVGAASALSLRFRKTRIVLVALAVAYGGAAMYWNAVTVMALWKNGGVDFWSDAGAALTREVGTRAGGRPVKTVDWGPNFTLYVATTGRIDPVALSWNRSAAATVEGRSWGEEVRRGGLYVRVSPDVRHDTTSSDAFMAALRSSRKRYQRIDIRQRDGRGYAEIYDVPPS